MKKLTAITAVFCLVMSFTLTACGGAELPEREEYPATTSRYSYNMLKTDESKDVYEALEKRMNADPNGEKTLKKFNGIDQTQFQLGYLAYTDDHPEVFWDVTGYITSGLGFEVKGMYVASRYSKKELKEMKLKLNEKIDEFLSTVPSGKSPKELEKFTHDYLIENCEYDYDASAENENKDSKGKSDSAIIAGTAYGAIVNGKAVCQGYARAYQLLLNRLGVDCVIIRGKAEPKKDTILFNLTGANHAWNAVKNGTTWLMTDVTWDDNDFDTMRYFNIPIDQMYKDHTARQINQDIYSYNVHFRTFGQDDCIFLPE